MAKGGLRINPIESTERLYVRVARRIADLVARGEVNPGDKLPSERDLAEMLQVSRPTVREAMIALEVSGLIEIRTGSGIYVLERHANPVLADGGMGPFEILEMRMLLEPEAAALAAKRISDAQLEALGQVLADMQRSEMTPDVEQHDRRFHTLIARATENGAIEATVDWLWQLRAGAQLNQAFHQRILEEGIYPVLGQHTEIFEAIKARDSQNARQAMRRHLGESISAAALFGNRDG